MVWGTISDAKPRLSFAYNKIKISCPGWRPAAVGWSGQAYCDSGDSPTFEVAGIATNFGCTFHTRPPSEVPRVESRSKTAFGNYQCGPKREGSTSSISGKGAYLSD